MSKFKVGDRIVMNSCANDEYAHTTCGAKGVVTEIDGDYITVDFDNSTLTDYYDDGISIFDVKSDYADLDTATNDNLDVVLLVQDLKTIVDRYGFDKVRITLDLLNMF